jgi:hypothetical protein
VRPARLRASIPGEGSRGQHGEDQRRNDRVRRAPGAARRECRVRGGADRGWLSDGAPHRRLRGETGGSRGSARVRSARDALQIDHEIAHRLIALGGILLDRLGDDRAQWLRYLHRQRLGLVVHDGVHEVELGGAVERPAARQHLVEHDAEREDVAARVEHAARDLLGRHIGRCPDHGACTRVRCARVIGRRLLHGLRQAEIRELRVPRTAYEHVGGLHVAMQHAGGVRRRERVRHADQELRHLPPRTRLGMPPLLQRAAVDEFRDEILRARVFADVVHCDDVRMIERRRQLGFALKAPAGARVEKRLRQELDRDGPVEPRVGCTIDDAHAAAAQDSVDAIAADDDAWANRCRALGLARESARPKLGRISPREQRFHRAP